MGNKVSLEDEMVNLRIVSKQMQRSAKKCEKNEKAALAKLKKVRAPIRRKVTKSVSGNRAVDLMVGWLVVSFLSLCTSWCLIL